MQKKGLILLALVALQACGSEPKDIKERVEKIDEEKAAREIQKTVKEDPKEIDKIKKRTTDNVVKTAKCILKIQIIDDSGISEDMSQFENCSALQIAFLHWASSLVENSWCSLKKSVTVRDLKAMTKAMLEKAKKVASKLGLSEDEETSCVVQEILSGE